MANTSVNIIAVLIIGIALVPPLLCEDSPSCESQATCDSCIGTVGCAWCQTLSLETFNRCFSTNKNSKCAKEDIMIANPAKDSKVQDKPISEEMRIQPQKVKVELAVGKPVEVILKYKDITDKPLDLYYIMDLSATMKDDKETVSKQAQQLVTALRGITKDVRLGFGSFIDKPVLPFVSSSQLRGDPDTDGTKFDIPYAFKNLLSITDDIAKFAKTVKDAQISRNLDEPEGTLDALMQAIKCKKEIGWRNDSRKLIVVATDGPFHIAGDGRLGGVVRPNDMKCHMEGNSYTYSKILDYPSIGEINAAIMEHKVYVIFAISTLQGNQVFKVYEELQKHITQSTAKELAANSQNVVQTIKKKYEEISKSVDLKIDDCPKYVKVDVEAKCKPQNIYNATTLCNDVGVGSEIFYKLRITLKECPKPSEVKGKDQVVVSFFELNDNEKLVIDLSYACQCSCQKDIDEYHLKTHCTSPNVTQYISCGSCMCKSGRTGEKCQCSTSDETSQGNSTKCYTPNSKNGEECSSRGDCKCDQCVCYKGYNGKYCEDSTFSCQNPNNRDKICSDHGVCNKEKCECRGGYEGNYCQCQTSKKKSCVEPGKSLNNFCNGNGECECEGDKDNARCKCKPGYGGLYCEQCKQNNCESKSHSHQRCEDKQIQNCVKCRLLKNENECYDVCSPYRQASHSGSSREDIKSIEFEHRISLDFDGTECKVNINSTCSATFRFNYDRSSPQDQDIIRVFYSKSTISCPKEPPILWLIFGVISSVLLAGIFGLLIWKLATYIHDSREFQKFEKEKALAKWQGGENPLYNKPTTEFSNPAYRE